MRKIKTISLWGFLMSSKKIILSAAAAGILALNGCGSNDSNFESITDPEVQVIHGIDGRDGVDGVDGTDGRDGVDANGTVPTTPLPAFSLSMRVTLPLGQNALTILADANYDNDFVVDFGDGYISERNDIDQGHIYSSAGGTYDIVITGSYKHLLTSAAGGSIEIIDWSSSNLESLEGSFAGLADANVPDALPAAVTKIDSAFASNYYFDDPDVAAWNTTNIQSALYVFSDAASFNQPVGNWDISNTLYIDGMFFGALSFNQPLDSWDISNKYSLSNVFNGAISFNQPLGSWDTAGIYYFDALFKGAISFNQPLDGWNTINGTSFNEMLMNATSFDSSVSGLVGAAATNLDKVFAGATAFNQPLDGWDTQNVTTWRFFLDTASSFNQPLASLDMRSAVDIHSILRGTPFNHSIGNWDTRNVVDMGQAFYDAAAFDQDLSGWNVESVTNLENFGSLSGMSNTNYDNLLNGWSTQNLQQNLRFDMLSVSYTANGAAARQSIIDNFNWTIYGDSQI